jgi:hypothetical protein
MFRFGVAALLMFALVGCVKTRIAAQDFQSGTFTVCGNNHAAISDLNAKAAEQCPSGARPLRCAEEKYGTASYAHANAYGGQGYANAYGYSTTKDLVGNCCEFACPTAAAPGAERGTVPLSSR